MEVSGESPYIDFQQKLTEDEYIYYNEQEILFPPFLPLKIEELALTKGEKKMIKDMHNNPPVGKYLIQPGSFPDYREIIKSSKEELYEITDNAHVLAPKNIIEKLVLEIPVNISQMSALTCGRTCKKVGIDRNRLSQQGIVLVCGQECKDNGNQERNCNFLCKWFCVKNENLIKELAALKEYLNRNKNNYFKSAIEIRIKCNDRTSLDARQFEILNEYIGKM